MIIRKFQVLSGSWLKVIAMIAMTIDHTAEFLPVIYQKSELLYVLMRTIGRIAFPVFAFLVVESFIHTRNRKHYARNLLITALISQVPWALVHGSGAFWLHGNVCFTLLLGFLSLCIWEKLKGNRQIIALVAVFSVAYLLRVNYNFVGVGLILLLYVLRAHNGLRLLLGTCVIVQKYTIGVVTGFTLLAMYNGKRGFINGPVGKYSFYAFYPLHLLILFLLQSFNFFT